MTTQHAERHFRAGLTAALQGHVQAELADALGISPQLVSDWKAGRRRPDPDQVFALERALALQPGQLSRHLGYRPVQRDAEIKADIASDASRTIRDYLGEDVDLILADIEDFDSFAREIVEDGLRRRLLQMVVDDVASERGKPVDEATTQWAQQALDRANAAPQGLFEA